MSAEYLFNDPTQRDGCYRKHPSSVRIITLDWFGAVASFWEPGVQYAASAIVRPRVWTGFAYQADGGQAGTVEPAWPSTVSSTVVDGGITWTSIAAAANGVVAVTSPVIVIAPSGELSAGSPSVVNGEGTSTGVQFALSSGVAGKVYRVECQVTVGSETLLGSLRVKAGLR